MLEIFAWGTPNGRKPLLLLEELGVEYKLTQVPLDGPQKEPWFLKINPNGRIPAMVDHDEEITIFESGAMMIYIAEKYGQFLPESGADRAATLSWLMFQMGGIGPMFGQFYHFKYSAPEKLPYAIERYQTESQRLYGVMELQLSQTPYLAGDTYTIADMITYPWAYRPDAFELDTAAHPGVMRWIETMGARPAVQKAMAIEFKKEEG
jgi:GST-like protein